MTGAYAWALMGRGGVLALMKSQPRWIGYGEATRPRDFHGAPPRLCQLPCHVADLDDLRVSLISERSHPGSATTRNRLMFCGKCGNKAVEGDQFCVTCGQAQRPVSGLKSVAVDVLDEP